MLMSLLISCLCEMTEHSGSNWVILLISRLTPWSHEQVCGLAHLKSASFTK